MTPTSGGAVRPFRNVLTATALIALLAGCAGDDTGDDAEPSATADADADAGETTDADVDVDDVAADGDAADADAALEEADEPRTFAAGDDIPVSLSLFASEDGGRQTGIFGGYRGEVSFAGQEALTCSVGGPAEGGAIEPGETHDVALTCPEDVTLEPGQDELLVVEGGREIATGTVLPGGGTDQA